jgi:phosphatidylglycerophosphate synthase
MIDSFFRPLKDRFLSPLVAGLSRFATPNGLSAAAFLAGIACAAALLLHRPVLAFGLWLVNRILDGLDGAFARAGGKTRDSGGYLDIMLDFIVYAALPLGMIYRASDLALARAGAVLLASFYVNAASWMYLAALIEKRKTGDGGAAEVGSPRATSVTMPVGLIEGTETVVFYSLMILLPAWRGPLFWACAGLTIAGAGMRFLLGLRMLSDRRGPAAGEGRG